MGKRKHVTLYSPDGRLNRTVLTPSSAVDFLRRAGWTETRPIVANTIQEGTGSETAQRAREDLARLSPEAWVKEWGLVLVDALDQTERQRSWLVLKLTVLSKAIGFYLQSVVAVGDAAFSWITRTGWTGGAPVLEPTQERQAAAEDLVRTVMEVFSRVKRHADSLSNLGGEARAELQRPGDPVARARASAILEELQRELATSAGPGTEAARQQVADAIAQVRASFLGGSNVPGVDDSGEIPS